MKDTKKLNNYREKYKQHYGIDFGREYAIHHIDGDRKNNDISNLLLLPSRLHSSYHAYRAMFTACAQDGICFDLTYSGSCVRSLQFSTLEQLREVLKEIQKWIELKYLADEGCSVYPLFKRSEQNGGI